MPPAGVPHKVVSTRVGFKSSITIKSVLDPRLSWQDAMSQVGPYTITDEDKWPRTLIATAGELFPAQNSEPRQFDVILARFTEGQGRDRTRVSQIDWWGDSGNYRPLEPRELFAAVQYSTFAHQVLGGPTMPVMRIASLFRFALGQNPHASKLLWVNTPTEGFFSVHWGENQGLKQVPEVGICLDGIGPSDYFGNGPWWFAFTSK